MHILNKVDPRWNLVEHQLKWEHDLKYNSQTLPIDYNLLNNW